MLSGVDSYENDRYGKGSVVFGHNHTFFVPVPPGLLTTDSDAHKKMQTLVKQGKAPCPQKALGSFHEFLQDKVDGPLCWERRLHQVDKQAQANLKAAVSAVARALEGRREGRTRASALPTDSLAPPAPRV